PEWRAAPQATSGRSREALPRELHERTTGTCLGPPGGADELDLTTQVEALDARLGEGARRELGLDRRPRDERHPVPGGDGAGDGLLEPELEADAEVAQPQPTSLELVLDHQPHAGALLHHDQPRLAHLVEGHRPPCERMPRRAGKDDLVAQERLEDDTA